MKKSLLSVLLSVLSGWNVAVITWFLLAITAASLMNQLGYRGGINKPHLILAALVALGLGLLVGKKIYPKFKILQSGWKIGWLIVLLIATAMFFPKPFMFAVS